jgi:enterochelin esterase-like enzyme
VFLATLLSVAALLPGFTAIDAPHGGGVLLQGVIPDASAPQPLQPGLVYLPPHFTTTRRYPVVYLLHGIRGTPSEYSHALQLRAYVDGQIQSGALRPFIAVVPAAADKTYRGEWAGPWGQYVTHGVVPWVDAHLPTVASARGRVLAGLSAGGFGAFDIGLRNPRMFGALASWSGYFHPLSDAPFTHAGPAVLRANTPTLLLRNRAPLLRRLGMRLFVSTGPSHSVLAPPAESAAIAREAQRLHVPVSYQVFASQRGHWRAELHAGLRWAFG